MKANLYIYINFRLSIESLRFEKLRDLVQISVNQASSYLCSCHKKCIETSGVQIHFTRRLPFETNVQGKESFLFLLFWKKHNQSPIKIYIKMYFEMNEFWRIPLRLITVLEIKFHWLEFMNFWRGYGLYWKSFFPKISHERFSIFFKPSRYYFYREFGHPVLSTVNNYSPDLWTTSNCYQAF